MSGVLLLLRLIGASLRSQAQYPGSAIMVTIGNFSAAIIEIVALWALFNRFGDVHGWRFGEVAIFFGLVNIMFAIADLLTRGFDVLGKDLVRTGAFDRLLLRPRSLTLQLVGYDFRVARAGRFLQGLIVLIVGARSIGLEWTVGDTMLALWAIAGGVALFFGILVLQGAASFWTIESLELANVLTYGGVQAAQFPLSVYSGWFRGLLTFVVPLACVAYFPIVTLLGHADPLGAPAWVGYLSPVAGFMFLAMSFLAWRFGVCHYTSTGS